MTDQTITERPTAFSITWHWTFCSEECGWESAATLDPAAAKAEGDAHALEVHGIPLPPPPGGYRLVCDVEHCGWTARSFESTEAMERYLADHMARHEADWASGRGPHKGHRLLYEDGSAAMCSCGKVVGS